MSPKSPIKIFGAKASIYLKHEGDIHTLAKKLSKGLMLPDFQIAPSEWPPHELAGSLEIFGWEVWLEAIQDVKPFHYTLKIETEHSVTESFNGDMHDLSPWLARYVSLTCGVETLIIGTQIMFSNGLEQALT